MQNTNTWREMDSAKIAYRRTPLGYRRQLFYGIKGRLKYSSAYRDRTLEFTMNEFLDWLEGTKYKDLYDAWARSGFKRDLAPSVDRIDNKGDYHLGNIQIITQKENTEKDKRKTICKRGHQLTDDNIYWYGGLRHCRTCVLNRVNERRRLKNNTTS